MRLCRIQLLKHSSCLTWSYVLHSCKPNTTSMLHSRTMTARNDTNSDVTSAPVALTKEYIRDAFKHLEETHDVEHRNEFFKRYMLEDVKWEITGNGHSLAGTRHSLADHSAASFNKLGKKLTSPIKFVVRSIILEPETRHACVETQGFATRTNGQPYNNDYVWVTHWTDDGKISSVRSYHDTHLAEEVLHE